MTPRLPGDYIFVRRRNICAAAQKSRQSVLEVQLFPEDFIRRALIELFETSNFDIDRIVLDQFRKENCRNILCQRPLDLTVPASCITFLSEQAFAPQNTRFWSRRRVWFQFTVGEDKPPMLSVDNRGKGVLSMDCSAKRSPL